MSWQRGRADVEQMLRTGELELVEPSPALADRLLDEADRHVRAAGLVREVDASGAYQLAYDAARKACAALLAVQGLRATSRGGHVAVQDTVRGQFGGSGGAAGAFDAFPRLRRKRASTEYPDVTSPSVTAAEIDDAVDVARAITQAARQLRGSGRLGPFNPQR